jgi:hypothetical protein
MDDASFAKFLGLVEQHYDGTRINWKAIAAELERWWRQRHPTNKKSRSTANKKCPYGSDQLITIYQSSMNALRREQGFVFGENFLT